MIKTFMKSFKRNKKGFTLVELMVVIVIIGVLTAIAIPVYNNSQQKARESVDEANQRILKSAAQQYVMEVGIDAVNGKVWSEASEDNVWKAYIEEWPENPNNKNEKDYIVTFTKDDDTNTIDIKISHGDKTPPETTQT